MTTELVYWNPRGTSEEGWYFVDETFSYVGPYETSDRARKMRQKYAEFLSGKGE